MFPKDFSLWRYYLRFVASYFTTFSVEKVLNAYRLCLDKLRHVQMQSFMDETKPVDLEDQMRCILSNLCHFLARSGFREKAVALFQANIEFNLFQPSLPGYYSMEDRLAVFEPFWESGVPRFGETGAQGWATVREIKDKVGMVAGVPDASQEHEEGKLQRKRSSSSIPFFLLHFMLPRLRLPHRVDRTTDRQITPMASDGAGPRKARLVPLEVSRG